MKQVVLLSTLIVLTLFVVLNVFSSQTISPLYFQMINHNPTATIHFLKDIKNLPEFKTELAKLSKQYNQPFKKDVFAQENERKQKIIYLKKLLKQNPKARDVLYNLSLLYQQEGNKNQTNQYFKQAKHIDPMINLDY